MSTLLFQDDETLQLAQNALAREMVIIQIGIKATQKQIRKFEKKFAINSDAFYEKYQRGEMGDDPDIMRWAMEIQALRKLTSDHRKLDEVKRVSG